MSLQDDTRVVREEFDGLSTPTQVFVATLVGLGVIVGLLLGGVTGYFTAVEEREQDDCIEYEEAVYCPEGPAQEEEG